MEVFLPGPGLHRLEGVFVDLVGIDRDDGDSPPGGGIVRGEVVDPVLVIDRVRAVVAGEDDDHGLVVGEFFPAMLAAIGADEPCPGGNDVTDRPVGVEGACLGASRGEEQQAGERMEREGQTEDSGLERHRRFPERRSQRPPPESSATRGGLRIFSRIPHQIQALEPANSSEGSQS